MKNHKLKFKTRSNILTFVFSLVLLNFYFSLLTSLTLKVSEVKAATAVPQSITFQGKVVNADGTNVTDGAYDFEFKIYNGASSGASTLFTETWSSAALLSSQMSSAPGNGGTSSVYSTATNESSLKVGQVLWNTTKGEPVIITAVDTGTNTITHSATRQAWAGTDTITNRIYVKDGIFKVALNSLNANWGTVNFADDQLFLGINYQSDGEMKPRVQFTSSAYSLYSENTHSIGNLSATTATNDTTLTNADTGKLTIDVGGGNNAGEDLILTAHNLQLTATGALTLSPDADVTTAIDLTDSNFTNALSLADNAILGTTAIINFDNFDVDATGDITFLGGDLTGTNGETIDIGEADNGSFIFSATGETNNESIEFDLETAANTLSLFSSTGVVAIDLGSSMYLTNIGAAGTDFTSTGGLTLDDILTVNDDLTINAAAGENLEILDAAAITTDLVSIVSDAATTTAGANALQIDFTTGDGASVTNSALEINGASGGSAAGDIFYGLNLNMDAADASTQTAINLNANWDTDINATTDLTLGIGGTNEVTLTGSALYPSSDGGNALGITNTNEWGGLFLNTGATINFENSDVTLTHSANTLTLAGGNLAIGTNTLSGGAAVIDFTEFDVSGTTGSITIDDDGNAGQISIDGSVLDIDSLTFVGAGTLTSTGALTVGAATTTAITLTTDGTGNAEVVLPNDAIGPNELMSTGQSDEYCLSFESTGSVLEWKDCAGTSYSAGNDIDFNVTQIDIEPQLDFVTTISRASSNLALQTTTSGDITLTTGAAAGLVNVLTGNLKVGNGTPTTSLNGNDAYITGTFEVDSTTSLDGAVTLGSTLTLPNTSVLTGDTTYLRSSRGLAFGANETYYINSSGTGNLNALTLASTLTLSNAETITNGTNGSVIFTGVGQTNNGAIAFDLETNTIPTLVSSTDTAIGLDEDLTFIGAQTIGANSGNLTIDSTSGNLTISDAVDLNNDLDLDSNSATALTVGDGTNTFLTLDATADAADTLFTLADTSNGITTGSIFSLSSGTSLTSGDILKITSNATTLTGNILALYNGSTAVFEVGTAQITSALPHSFTAAGDASFGYDLVLTNQTASKIESYGPLTIEAGEIFENNNLTLKTYGTGATTVSGKFSIGSQITFSANDTTPSVSSGNLFLTANASGTVISDFDDGSAGQVIFVEIGDANTDFDCTASGLDCGTTNITIPTAGDLYTFVSDGTQWKLVGSMLNNVNNNDATYNAGGVDIAEYFPSSQPLEPADLVTIGSDFPAQVTKSTSSYSQHSLGIVSTDPGIILGESGPNQFPIALAGRVPVKVTAEGGGINSGDPITSSSTAGKAMKATKAGRIVGYALEDWDGVSDTVLVFVNNTWHDPQTILTQSGDLNLPGDATIQGSLTVGGVDITEELALLDSRLSTTESLISSLTNSYSLLTNDLLSHTTTLNTLTSQYAGLATNVSSLESVVSSQQTDISNIQNLTSNITPDAIGIGVPAPATDSGKLVDTLSGAYLSASGVWTNVSDETKKTNFTDLDKDKVLAGILELGITRWNYRSDSDHITHIGPTAQQFYSVFGVGDNNTTISTLDPASIALVGVQALAERLSSQESVVRSQGEQIGSLESAVSSQQKDISYLLDINLEGNVKKLAEEIEEMRLAEAQSNNLQDTNNKQITNTNDQKINEDGIQYTEYSIQKNAESDNLLATLSQRLETLEGLILGTTDTLPEPYVTSLSATTTPNLSSTSRGEELLTTTSESDTNILPLLKGELEGVGIEASVSAALTNLEEKSDIDDILSPITDLNLSEFIATSSSNTASNSALLNTYLVHQVEPTSHQSSVISHPSSGVIIDSLSITTDLYLGSLALNAKANSISTISKPLRLQTNPLAGNIEAFDRKIIMTTNGDIEITGTLTATKVQTAEIEADKALAREAVLGKITIATNSAQLDKSNTIPPFDLSSSEATDSTNGHIGSLAEVAVAQEDTITHHSLSNFSPSIGTAHINPRATRTFVPNNTVTSNSKVFITPTTLTASPVSVIGIQPGIGFTVATKEPTLEPIQFNWWIIN